jgi:hypothetical protein
MTVALVTSEPFTAAGLAAKSLSIDGGAATSSKPTAYAVKTGANGKATFKFSTVGVGADVTFSVVVTSAELSASVDLITKGAAFSATAVTDYYAATPGTAVKMDYEVEDQWGVASDRTNQRLVVTRAGSGFVYAETVSAIAVTGGKASFDFTPSPATKTGSATVTAELQSLNADTGVWTKIAGSTNAVVTVNVTDKADAITGSALASVSASISYNAAAGKYSWSPAVALKVVNAGSLVTVSVPNAVIEHDSKTYSGTVTARADTNGTLTLKFASTKAGKHTVTYTQGTSTTTSEFIVSAAVEGDAASITLPTQDLVSGQTNTITGVLADKLGNPVEATVRKVTVQWTGKGLPFNIGSVVTDEDGKFTFQVLVLAGETGAGSVTATFKPTAKAADDISVVKAYTIAAPAAVAGPEINAVIGTFNGRWAVRVENAKGAAVSVKVGGRWVKFTALNDNYLFSRKSRVGASVAVAVYVNGQLENVATITIK